MNYLKNEQVDNHPGGFSESLSKFYHGSAFTTTCTEDSVCCFMWITVLANLQAVQELIYGVSGLIGSLPSSANISVARPANILRG